MKTLSINQAAEIVGVSIATMRNWSKAGYIQPTNRHPLTFSEDSVHLLRRDISTGVFQKLKIRANKACSDNKMFPVEYLSNTNVSGLLENLLECIKNASVELEPLLFATCLRLFEFDGEVVREPHSDIFEFDSYHSWRRASTKKEMQEWHISLNKFENIQEYHEIIGSLHFEETDDLLGLLYQSFSLEGDKSERGAYYTPSNIVADSLADIAKSERDSLIFLDPCCGTG